MAATKVNHLDIATFLGGAQVLGPFEEPADIQHAIRAGLPYGALEALADVLELTRTDVTAVLGMAPRTLTRRKQGRHLSPAESDRLYRLARITSLAAEVLGGLD